MELFCTDGEWIRFRDRDRRYTWLFRILAVSSPVLFVLLCFFVRTANARVMHIVMLAVPGLLGAAAIIVYILLARPARRELKHLEMLRNSEKEEMEGRLTVTGDSFRIPKSVRVRRVILDTGGVRPAVLSVDERWVSRMPPDGETVRLATVHSYIAGADCPAPAGEARAVPRKKPAVRAFFRVAADLLPLLFLWAFAVLIFGSFIFYQITDTVPAHKITLFVDGQTVNEDRLAARLEEGLPDPIQMVKVHPFSYMMFGDEELKTADLYIVPDSHAKQYGEWFAPGSESFPVCDPETSLAVAGEYILYAPEGAGSEPFRLYLGSGSVHLEDGLAARAAQLLLDLETEKEENP